MIALFCKFIINEWSNNNKKKNANHQTHTFHAQDNCFFFHPFGSSTNQCDNQPDLQVCKLTRASHNKKKIWLNYSKFTEMIMQNVVEFGWHAEQIFIYFFCALWKFDFMNKAFIRCFFMPPCGLSLTYKDRCWFPYF